VRQLLRSLCSALACFAPALASALAAQDVDAVYAALGQGDLQKAAELSAALLERPDEDALQARLDVLYERSELDKPEGVALHAASEGHGDLPQRFALLDDVLNKKAADALKNAQVLLTQAQRTPAETSELQFIVARAAALANRMDDVRPAALAAQPYWQAQHGARAAWHQMQLTYLIGNQYYITGSKSDALTQFEVAAKIAVAAFGADSSSRMKMDTERASALVQLGRNSEALTIREDLIGAARGRYGETSVEVARAHANVGAGLQEIGDYPAARTHYAQAEATLAALPDDGNRAHTQQRAIIAANYANLLQEMGEEEPALAHYRQALDMVGSDPQTARMRAIVTTNIGNTEFRMHRYDAAVADFQSALALREAADGKDSPGLGFALEGLGSVSLALHRYADAEQYFARALQVKGRGVSPTHPTLAVFNFGLALAHWGQHHSDEAFRYATLTAENQHALLGTFASEFSERQSVAYRDILVPATALVVTLAAERGDADSVAAAWHLAMIERGLVARAQAHKLAAARSTKDAEIAKVWEAWRHANSALGEAWLATNTTPERMAELRGDAESAERALWLRIGRDPNEAIAKGIEISDLAKNLPRDARLLAFSEGIASEAAGALAAGDKPAPDLWYAFVLGADAKPKLQRVGSIDALSAQVREWYGRLRDPDADAAALRRTGLALRHALFDPFVGKNDKSLFIVPEGELFRVSFAALPGEKHGYLVESGVRVHTLDHEGDLVLPATSTANATALLAGAPNFPQMEKTSETASRALCVRAARSGFAAIPNAARELDELHALLAPQDATVRVVAGADATKDNVLAALPQASIIHLATHGFSLDGSCADAAPARGVTLDAERSITAVSSAATLSGLAFSGAEIAAGREPVGVLSAGEIGALDLSHADWVALSACDSGLGPIGRNEGVFGMRRALRLAGARTVVMSLWQVDDAATADLMHTLYRERFVAHRDVPSAMTTAMQTVLASRRAAGQSDHPYYWAAFISEGGWR
jgi:CHAT domain-containing protein/tetratricopeptide (TPR) repeat protein